MGSGHHQPSGDEEKIKKEENQKEVEIKLCSKNHIKRINTLDVPLVRYQRLFLKWTRGEMNQMVQRTRKLMTMDKALDLRDDVDRLCVSRKEGGGELICIEDNVDASIQRLKDYIEKRGERLIKASRNNTDNTRTNRTTINRKQKWEEDNSMKVLSD